VLAGFHNIRFLGHRAVLGGEIGLTDLWLIDFVAVRNNEFGKRTSCAPRGDAHTSGNASNF
jgi:hypothetical protein